MANLDTEWVALIEEAKALGLTVEEVREELEKHKEEKVC
jgi:DNA-binding transcriptional MerR regulator